MKSGIVILTALALMAGTALAEAPLVPEEGRTPEQNMAIINAEHWVRTDDVTIARFRFLLKELHDATGEEPKRIADMLVHTQEIIARDYGKKIALLELTENVYAGTRNGGLHGMPLANFLVYFAVLFGAAPAN